MISSSSDQQGRSAAINFSRSMIMLSRSLQELPLFHAQVLGDKVHIETVIINEGKPDPAPLQHLFELPEVAPTKVGAEFPVEVIMGFNIGAREKRLRVRGFWHVDEHQMLPRKQTDIPHEAFSKHRILQRRKKNEQGAATQPQPNECGKLLEIR